MPLMSRRGPSVAGRLRNWLYLPTSGLRKKRMQQFLDTFGDSAAMTILDVGGTDTNWRLVEVRADVTFVNIVLPTEPSDVPPNMRYVRGDGTALEYPDGSYDICFSNSTIEHVFTWEQQRRFAAEVRRVGDGVWMQTPAREFPFEPHWLTPFIHWLPKRWQVKLGRNLTLYGLAYRPSREQVEELVDEYRLLTLKEMKELFPDCEIRRERFLGLTKSYIAVRPRRATSLGPADHS